jgi:hypothetical protein
MQKVENLGKIQLIKLATQHKSYASLMIFELGFFDQLLWDFFFFFCFWCMRFFFGGGVSVFQSWKTIFAIFVGHSYQVTILSVIYACSYRHDCGKSFVFQHLWKNYQLVICIFSMSNWLILKFILKSMKLDFETVWFLLFLILS